MDADRSLVAEAARCPAAPPGVVVQPEFSYTRTVNGFSAAFDARGIALLERAADVAGVYPVRAAYPASLSSRLLTSSGFGERRTSGSPTRTAAV